MDKQELNLTATQKKEIYQRAIKLMENAMKVGNFLGLCWCISGAAYELKHGEAGEDVAYGTNMKHNFPEVYKFKPLTRDWYNYHYWYSNDGEGMLKRIEILKKAIIKVEKLEKLCNLLQS